MVVAAKTLNTELLIGREDDWFVNLTGRANTFEVAGSVNVEREAVFGDGDTRAEGISATHTTTIGTVYASDETDMVRSHIRDELNPWVVLRDRAGGWAYCIESLLLGIPEDAPTNGLITESLAMPQAQEGFGALDSRDAEAVFDFSFVGASDTDAVAIGTPIATTDGVFLVVTEYTPELGAHTISVGGVAVAVSKPGTYRVGPFAAAAAAPNVDVSDANPADGQSIVGFVVIGKPLGEVD